MINTEEIPYVYMRDGFYYFNRRVPMDLQGHYRCPRIIVSLRTKSALAANTKSVTLASQLDEEWLTLRWRQKDNPLGRFLISNDEHSYAPSDAPLLSEAKSIYVTVKSGGRSLAFSQAADRAVSNLIDAVGDKPIDRYSRKDVNLLRDQLFDRGLSKTSIKRFFGTISDTGMRLSEAAGLHKGAVVLDDEYPHIVLKPHPWRRPKNMSSERIVPLVGVALWAARRAIQSTSTDFLFPRYCDETICKSNSASATLNKWLSSRVSDGGVIHSFRRSFRDRLRAVECPQDITDRLGGWAVGGVGEGYGSGYPIEVLYKWMDKALS